MLAYTEKSGTGDITPVPDVMGMTYENAKKTLENAGLVIKLDGNTAESDLGADAIAVSQSPDSKAEVASGTAVYVKFVQRESD